METPERSGKPIPDWARGARLMDALRRQQFMDPDKVFSARRTDCPLEEVFHGVGELPMSWSVQCSSYAG